MQLPEYVSKQEVQRVCRELGLRDWTAMTGDELSLDEARIVQHQTGGEALEISLEEFRSGLVVELEHGITFPEANVTNNHPLLTGRIVLAHLKESLEYYLRLDVAEIEGDMMRAVLDGDEPQLARKYAQLLQARHRLSQREAEATAA